MLKHTPLRRGLAYGVTLVFLCTLASPLLAAPPPEVARAEPVRVAVGPCADESKQPFGNLAAQAAAALRLALTSSPRYECAGERDVPGRVMRCTVLDVTTSAKPRAVVVRLTAEWRDPVTGQTLLRTEASGRGSAPARTGDDTLLAKAALDAAATAAVAQIAKVADIIGHVIETQKRGHIRVDLGRDIGITPGTELQVFRQGEEICTIQARNIFPSDADCVIVKSIQGKQAQVGDEVKVVYIPDTKEKRRHSNESGARKFGIAVLAALAALVAINWDGGERRAVAVKTRVNVGVSKTDIKNDGIDVVTITAIVEDPAGTPVPDGTPVTFSLDTGSASGLLDGSVPPVTVPTSGGLGIAEVDLTTTAAAGSTIRIVASATDATTSRTVSATTPDISVHL
jgi:hypothetical protein